MTPLLTSGLQIIIPLLRTPEEAKAIVQAAKFPPVGTRGFGSPLSMERFSPVPSFTEYLQQANDTLLTIVQIETKEALDSVEQIAAVDGIDCLFIGPFDLGKTNITSPHWAATGRNIHCLSFSNVHVIANNIGAPIVNGVVPDKLKEAIGRILKASHDAGKKCGIFSVSGEQAKAFASQGFDMISVATDHTTLEFVMAAALSTAKGGAQPEKGKSY